MSGIVNDHEHNKTLGILAELAIAALAIVALVVCLFRVASCQEHQDTVIAEMRSKQVEAKKEATP